METQGLPADFVLASGSPRRRQLLEQMGTRFRVQPVRADESILAGEQPDAYVKRLALAKARLGREQPGEAVLPVLAADTAVVVDDSVYGKPFSEAHCTAMLMHLSDREHRVLTAVALATDVGTEMRCTATRVRFTRLTEDLCRRYWCTGEPRDKAGGYAIQGLGAVFVQSINGSYTGVVGLPLAETRELLQWAAIPCWCT